MSKKKQVFSPAESPARQSFLELIEQQGFDTKSLRILLWLINAHPDLINHGKVFENILEIFQGPLCHENSLAWASGDWTDELPEWRSMLSHIVLQREVICQHPHLKEFYYPSSSKNVLIGNHSIRHPVVCALETDHIDSATQVQPTTHTQRLRQLQGHVLLAYMESRCFETSIEQYESYAGINEFPVAPSASGPVSVAIRGFSVRDNSDLFDRLPLSDDTSNYAQLITTKVDRPKDKLSSQRYQALHLFFKRFLGQLECEPTTIRKRSKQDGHGSGNRWKFGFVKGATTQNSVVFIPPAPPSDDPDFVATKDIEVSFVKCLEKDLRSSELSGISPFEELTSSFHLVDPTNYGQAIGKRKFQQLAVEMQAHRFPWSYTSLTGGEIACIHQKIQRLFEVYLSGQASNKSEALGNAKFALMLKTSLLLGQTLDRVREMHLSEDKPTGDDSTLAQTLVFQVTHVDDAVKNSVARHPVGFHIPAAMPVYQSDFPDELRPHSTFPEKYLQLPNLTDLGGQLCQLILKERRRPGDRLFGLEPKTVSKLSAEFFSEFATKAKNAPVKKRITANKIEHYLEQQLPRQTTDQVACWLITNAPAAPGEPRLFYTQYRTGMLVDIYERTISQLCNIANIPFVARTEVSQDQVIGARFVVHQEALKQLVACTQEPLRATLRADLETLEDIARYHNEFCFYTWLIQSLCTSLRAIRRPNEVIRQRLYQLRGNRLQAGIDDKDSEDKERTRLAFLPQVLVKQIDFYDNHFKSVKDLAVLPVMKSEEGKRSPLMVFKMDDCTLTELTPKWIQETLRRKNMPIPANFHRAYLRSALLQQGCPGEVIDAFLGHANLGELPFAKYSSFDFQVYAQTITAHLERLINDLGITALPSRLNQHTVRWNPR